MKMNQGSWPYKIVQQPMFSRRPDWDMPDDKCTFWRQFTFSVVAHYLSMIAFMLFGASMVIALVISAYSIIYNFGDVTSLAMVEAVFRSTFGDGMAYYTDAFLGWVDDPVTPWQWVYTVLGGVFIAMIGFLGMGFIICIVPVAIGMVICGVLIYFIAVGIKYVYDRIATKAMEKEIIATKVNNVTEVHGKFCTRMEYISEDD